MRNKWIVLGVVIILLTGCQSEDTASTMEATPTVPEATITSTPTTESTPVEDVVWLPAYIPESLRAQVIEQGIAISDSQADANIWLSLADSPNEGSINWVYALVCPFPTVNDGVTLTDLQFTWKGEASDVLSLPLHLSGQTQGIFTELWGKPSEGVTLIEPSNQLLNSAWQAENECAIIPFEEIQPRWKVMAIDGLNPLEKPFAPSGYGLSVWFAWSDGESPQTPHPFDLKGNRDPQNMTTVMVTGTTALVRGIAARMEQKGITYPAEEIGGWLKEADITHISNESSFTEACTVENPWTMGATFCSKPEYIGLLEAVGTDVVELTGNHLADYGLEPLTDTLDLLHAHGMRTYAAGLTEADARQPLLLEHNDTKIAFLGCNEAGPERVWATPDSVGVYKCDLDWMEETIEALNNEVYQVIVTFQYRETWDLKPMPWQRDDFARMAQAGAVIVSGSQAHLPMAMTFLGNSFLPYGLGNLFFDQMDTPMVGTLRELLTRHVFYAGKYINTQLLTAELEDYSQPRPMTVEERAEFLSELFNASVWQEENP